MTQHLLEMQRQIDALAREVERLKTVEKPIKTTWAAPTFNTGWTDFAGGYQAARYRMIGTIVYVDGLVKRTSGVATTIFTLPSGYRPPATALFGTGSAGAWARVDVDASGNVIYQGGGDPATWVTLSGIQFSVL